MRFPVKKLYTFTIIIGITLIVGLSQLNSSSYAFFDNDNNILKRKLITTNYAAFEHNSNKVENSITN